MITEPTLLFDNIVRSELKSDSPFESIFRDINQYDWPGSTYIRNTLESWFEKYPPRHRTEFRERFRDDDPHHEGAFFELFLHELLTRLGFSLEVHPEIAGSDDRPDFLVSRDNRRFYLEATVRGQRSGPFTCNRNEEDVINKLNTLTSSHFGITVHMEGTLLRTLSREDVIRPFGNLLESNRPDEVRRLIDEQGRKAAPSQRIECGNWSLEGWLSPNLPIDRTRQPRRRFVIGHHLGAFTDCATPVRKALREKARKYRNLDAPLVLAVNTRDMFYDAPHHDFDVLYGNEQLFYSKDNLDATPRFGREPNGVWSRGRGSQMDDFLSIQKVDMWNIYYASASLYLNSNNTHTVFPDALFRLPHVKAINGEVKRFKGENVAQLVGVGLG